MRKTIRTISLIAALSGFAIATHAQLVVWSQNFDAETPGSYGQHIQDFGTSSNPQMNIATPSFTNNQAVQIQFDCTSGNNLNFQTATMEYPASGNTDLLLTNYTLDFDLAVEGPGDPGFYMQVGVYGTGSWIWWGDGISHDIPTADLPSAGSGYKHFSFPLSIFNKAANWLIPTNTAYFVSFGGLAWPAGITATPETVWVDNLIITMKTNPPPPPQPTLNVLATKPGLRIFGQNYSATWNQEGFATVDFNQSWVGATPSNPISYSITFEDFDTVDNYTFYSQFVPNAGINPYVVYAGEHALVWRITRVTGGFTTGVDWKTNLPNSGQPNNALTLATTSTDGRGTWTLTFTNDTDGTVTAPGGSSGSFSLPPDAAALFANPMGVYFGTAPNNTAGYGQYIDISRITITNVAGINEDDDFTKDDGLNTGLWDTGFSLDPGSVIQVSTNTPLWVNWTVPDVGYGLGTKASLNGGTNEWFSPNYYGGGTVTNSGPTQMGPSLKWTLIPNACLPTVDGTQGGTPSTTGFFRLSNPGPTQ